MHPYLTICTDILVRDKFLAIMSMFKLHLCQFSFIGVNFNTVVL